MIEQSKMADQITTETKSGLGALEVLRLRGADGRFISVDAAGRPIVRARRVRPQRGRSRDLLAPLRLLARVAAVVLPLPVATGPVKLPSLTWDE